MTPSRPRTRSNRRRAAGTALLTAALVLLPAAVASAHVTVAGQGATKGGTDATLTFRVPTEKDTATTTGLRVQLPTDTPLLGVAVAQVPGWTSTTKTTQLPTPVQTDDGPVSSVVSEIDWTTSDPTAAIRAGAVGLFPVLVGQLPDTGSLTFKAIQTYSDGSTVDWIETPAPGSSAEPEHPAPTLTLTGDAAAAGSADPAPSKGTSTTLPTVLAVVALVLGVLALGAAGVALRRRRA